jgi:prophage regulatory protein
MSEIISDRILRPGEAAEFLGVGRSTLYQWAKSPDFPPRIRLGLRAAGYRLSDLRQWIGGRPTTARSSRRAR